MVTLRIGSNGINSRNVEDIKITAIVDEIASISKKMCEVWCQFFWSDNSSQQK